jgi:hypothetical protein
LGRLRLITYLHDFSNISSHISKEKILRSDQYIDTDTVIKKAFFPKIQCDFSSKENPLNIVKSFEKQYGVLR